MSGACKSLDSIKAYADGARIDVFVGKRPRNGLELVECYKILAANSGTNFRSRLTIDDCGGILRRNYDNKASGVASSLKTLILPVL
jgi:hypothetical protein